MQVQWSFFSNYREMFGFRSADSNNAKFWLDMFLKCHCFANEWKQFWVFATQDLFPDLDVNNIEVKEQAMLAVYVVGTEIKIILFGEHRKQKSSETRDET